MLRSFAENRKVEPIEDSDILEAEPLDSVDRLLAADEPVMVFARGPSLPRLSGLRPTFDDPPTLRRLPEDGESTSGSLFPVAIANEAPASWRVSAHKTMKIRRALGDEPTGTMLIVQGRPSAIWAGALLAIGAMSGIVGSYAVGSPRDPSASAAVARAVPEACEAPRVSAAPPVTPSLPAPPAEKQIVAHVVPPAPPVIITRAPVAKPAPPPSASVAHKPPPPEAAPSHPKASVPRAPAETGADALATAQLRAALQ